MKRCFATLWHKPNTTQSDSSRSEPIHVHLCWSRKGSHQDLFLPPLVLWIILFDLNIGWVLHKLPTVPHAHPTPARNIHTAAESETSQVKSRLAVDEAWSKSEWELLGNRCSVSCCRIKPVWLAELYSACRVCFDWESVFGLGQLWKLGSASPAVTKLQS